MDQRIAIILRCIGDVSCNDAACPTNVLKNVQWCKKMQSAGMQCENLTKEIGKC